MYAQTGTIVDEKFEILGTIGSGGMGVVYEAMQKGIERHVALKLLTAVSGQGTDDLARFEQEAYILSRLMHPNIVQFYAYGLWHSTPYIAMEEISGVSLQKLLEGNKPLPVEQTVAIMEPVCQAMHHAHLQNVFHRDLKPSNIIVTENSGTPKIIDFGLAKLIGSEAYQRLTQTGATMGSVLYMSPEQCTGSGIDGRADIYSIGCILYHCATGVPPFMADNATALMFQHLNQPIGQSEHWKKISPGLRAIISTCTNKEPENRYQSALEISQALLELQKNPGTPTADPSIGARHQSKINFKTWTIAAAIALLGLIMAMFYHLNAAKPVDDEILADRLRTIAASSDESGKLPPDLENELDQAIAVYERTTLPDLDTLDMAYFQLTKSFVKRKQAQRASDVAMRAVKLFRPLKGKTPPHYMWLALLHADFLRMTDPKAADSLVEEALKRIAQDKGPRFYDTALEMATYIGSTNENISRPLATEVLQSPSAEQRAQAQKLLDSLNRK